MLKSMETEPQKHGYNKDGLVGDSEVEDYEEATRTHLLDPNTKTAMVEDYAEATRTHLLDPNTKKRVEKLQRVKQGSKIYFLGLQKGVKECSVGGGGGGGRLVFGETLSVGGGGKECIGRGGGGEGLTSDDGGGGGCDLKEGEDPEEGGGREGDQAPWLVLQAPVVKKYPARLSVTSYQCFFGVIQFLVIAAFIERDPQAWLVHSAGELFSVAYAGRVASGIAFAVQIWCIDRGGPVFVAVYQPVQTLVVAIMASLALGEEFYLGGIIGAVLIIAGL
ncbi:hypothetical protein TEA_007295 [Camellia sinensis var. sinensis]|uniref:WAT1-related protein n=1 Tax=Camellia sinensis var. sinensis TaxID=542762 RepID=A0A4S4D4Z1_CAMSN|nr:hypothetical protein TEA_007295 [Camellia sinensis var. sinensis]